VQRKNLKRREGGIGKKQTEEGTQPTSIQYGMSIKEENERAKNQVR